MHRLLLLIYLFYCLIIIVIIIVVYNIFLVMKKMKHRMVENMSSSTADALGLSRAILCNGKERFQNQSN